MVSETNKKSRNMLYLIFFSLLFFSLTSCFPFFKYPLPKQPNSKSDPQLMGAWILTTQTGHKIYMFIFPRNSEWFDLLCISNMDGEDSSMGINISIMEGYSTLINDEKFLSLRLRRRDFLDPNEIKVLPFLIVNYEISGSDELNIKFISGEKVDDLVKEGKLKAEAIKQEMPLGVIVDANLVTSSSEELKDVIANKGIKTLLANSSDDIAQAYSKIGLGSFVGQDKIFVMTFKRAIIEEKK